MTKAIKAPINLRKSRILVTNDDGIHAPGLKVLEKIAKTLSDDVWVVFEEVAAKDWYVGQTSVQERRKAAGK